MHHDVVDIVTLDVEASGKTVHNQIEDQRDQVRGIKAAQAALPESAEADLMRLSGGTCFGPLQMNAKARNDEEEKDTDVAITAEGVNEEARPPQQTARHGRIQSALRVIKHDAERGN